eukprot:6175435-Pleurochrysis_carterae.AAC.1
MASARCAEVYARRNDLTSEHRRGTLLLSPRTRAAASKAARVRPAAHMSQASACNRASQPVRRSPTFAHHDADAREAEHKR